MGYMIPMFVCISCARGILRNETEKHFNACMLPQEDRLYKYQMIYNGGIDRTKNDLIVPRGINNFGSLVSM